MTLTDQTLEQSVDWPSKTPAMVKVDRWTLPGAGSLPQLPRTRPTPSRNVKNASCPSLSFDMNPTLPVRENSQVFKSGQNGDSHKRRVRFATFKNASPVERVYAYPAVPPGLFSDCFWSRKETRILRSTQRDVAEYYRYTKGEEISESILFLHRDSAIDESKRTAQDPQCMTEEDAILVLIECNTRGLEHFISSAFDEQREVVKRKILAIQASCREHDPNEVAILLRVWSQKLSAASTRYAQAIAKGDEALSRTDTNLPPQSPSPVTVNTPLCSDNSDCRFAMCA